MSRLSAAELWALPPEKFNAWRRENDYPRLLEYMKSQWSGFREWQREYELQDVDILQFGIAHFVRAGTGLRYAYEIEGTEDRWQTFLHEATDFQPMASVGYKYDNGSQIIRRLTFLPYQSWARKHGKIIHKDGHLDDVQLRSWDYKNAYLMGGIPLLKLGGLENDTLKLNAADIGNRNFDFVDLDNLYLGPRCRGNRFKIVAFSSMRNVVLDGSKNFWRFDQSTINVVDPKGLVLANGTFQDLHFTRMNVQLDLSNAVLRRCSFEDCSYSATYRSESRLSDCTFRVPLKGTSGTSRAISVYKHVRDQLLEQRDGEGAAHYHYLLSVARTRQNASPLFFKRESLKGYGTPTTIANLIQSWRFKQHSKEDFRRLSLKYVMSRVRWIFSPYAIAVVITSYAKWLGSQLSRFAWGYGTRPGRTLTFAAAIILICSTVFYFDPSSNTRGELVKSLYFSMGSFATMTFNDVFQSSDHLRFMVNAEALLGILSLGMFVSSFFAKLRD